MKTTIHEPTTQIGYPKLMKMDTLPIVIVLFWERYKGIIIHSNDKILPVGHVDEDWDMSRFEEYRGEVVMSN